ncbi:MAG TPA: hypothetical protein VHS06_12260 [Chloroflexota bacterium]|nr:hypothetical protein [Chloroflexota bacterium]
MDNQTPATEGITPHRRGRLAKLSGGIHVGFYSSKTLIEDGKKQQK